MIWLTDGNASNCWRILTSFCLTLQGHDLKLSIIQREIFWFIFNWINCFSLATIRAKLYRVQHILLNFLSLWTIIIRFIIRIFTMNFSCPFCDLFWWLKCCVWLGCYLFWLFRFLESFHFLIKMIWFCNVRNRIGF